MSDPTIALRLLSQFIKALSHKIRTPLSVVANDLQYIRSVQPTTDLVRPIEKVSAIAELLSLIGRGISHELHPEPFDLMQLFDEQKIPITFSNKVPCIIVADKALLKIAFQFLNDLFSFSLTGYARFGGVQVLDCVAYLHEVFEERGDFTLMTKLFNEKISRDTPNAPLIDAIFLAHSISLYGTFSDHEVKFQIQFPA